MDKLKNVVNYFREVGIKDSQSIKEQTRVRTGNELVLMGVIILSIREIYNIFTVASIERHLVIFGWLSIFAFTHFATKNGYQKIARSVTIALVFGFIMFLQVMMGHNTVCAEPVYGLLIYFIILCYDKKVQSIVIPLVCLAYCGLVYVNTNIYEPPFLGSVTLESQLIHTVLLFVFFFYVARRNMTFSLRNRALLKNQEQELVEKNTQLGKFNNIIAHDLKEPIRSIVSFANLLKRSKGNLERRKDLAGYIVRSGHQLDHLVDGVREFHELTDMKLVYASVDLEEMVDRVKSTLKVIDRNISINVSALPKVYSSKPSLQVVFENLIQNGVRFNKSAQISIEIWADINDEKVDIYFKDNGIGIESEYHESVFEMFKRLGTDDTKSPGLGLNLCRRMVERLGGTLDVHSSVLGEGSVFRLTLPHSQELIRLMKEKAEAELMTF